MSIVFTSLTSSVCLTLFLPGRVEGESIEILLVVMAFSFLVTNLFIYYLFYRVTKEYREKLGRQALEHRMAMNQQHMEEVNTLYQNLRAIRHDLLNHITIMDGMIQQRNYRELDSYFQTLRKNNLSVEQFVDCGHVSVNALINPKLSYAKELGIKVSIRASLAPDIKITETDLCALLANLMDNAIEACNHVKEPVLELDMHPERSYLSIVVRNTVEHDVLKDNPKLHTTKQDKQIHGIGLSIVHTIVDRYDGMIDFSVEEHMFTVKVLLEDREPKI